MAARLIPLSCKDPSSCPEDQMFGLLATRSTTALEAESNQDWYRSFGTLFLVG